MKKLGLIITSFIALGGLAACGKTNSKYKINFDIKGGSEEERDAMLNAVNKKSICLVGSASVTPVNENITLFEDNGDNLTIANTCKIKKYTVNIVWEFDNSDYVGERTEYNDNSDLVTINYKGYKQPDGELSWHIKEISCGGAKSTDSEKLTWNAKIVNSTLKFDEYTIAQINEVENKAKSVTSGGKTYEFPSTFKLINYDAEKDGKYSPYWTTNNPDAEFKNLYVKVSGKIVYLAPDGDWGILADGNEYIELFSGSARNLKESDYPAFKDKYVTIYGNLDAYYGNIQLTQIKKVTKCDPQNVTDPTTPYPELTSSFVNGLKVAGHPYQNQAVPGLMNSIRVAKGTVIDGTLYQTISGSPKTAITDVSKLQNNRFEFDLDLGDGAKVTVAYDYHTDLKADNGLFNALKAALTSGKQITLTGTMHYSKEADKEDFYYQDTNPGVWNITPMVVGDVVVAK